jgi:hypothetical protein
MKFNDLNDEERLAYWKEYLAGLVDFIVFYNRSLKFTQEQIYSVMAEANRIHKLILITESITYVEIESKLNSKENERNIKHGLSSPEQPISRRLHVAEVGTIAEL